MMQSQNPVEKNIVLVHPMMADHQLISMCRALEWVGAQSGVKYVLNVSSLMVNPNHPELIQFKANNTLRIYQLLTALDTAYSLGPDYPVDESNPITLTDRLSWTIVSIYRELACQGVENAWISKWGIIPLDPAGFERELHTRRVVGALILDSSCRECLKAHYAAQINVVEWFRGSKQSQKPGSEPVKNIVRDYDAGAPLLTHVQQFIDLCEVAKLRCFDPLNLWANATAHSSENEGANGLVGSKLVRLTSPNLITQWKMGGSKLQGASAVAVDHRLWPATLDMALADFFQ